MRLLSAHFIGLKGIYNKSQISEINIDFTKCTHNLIMIIGKNGSGKSTLIEVLTPLPDDPLMYIDNMVGQKEIIYFDDGNTYKVHIVYPYSNGRRGQTKAFLSEIQPDGTEIELNPNGNIGSFKEVLYSKFNLDPNFISLSRLSIEDRGIVEKKPSERKKYITTMLETTEVYNDIYKSLVKRSGTFKSMINSITAKIDSIGDEEKLNMELQSLISRLGFLQSQRENFNTQLSKASATVELLDPNGSIQSLYTELINEYNKNLEDIKTIELSLSGSKFKSEGETLERFKKLNDLKAALIANIDLCDSNIRTILVTKEDEMKSIQLKQQRIGTLSLDIDIDILKRNITESRKRIFEFENVFKKIGFEKFEITKEEYITGLSTLNNLRDMVMTMKSYASNSNILLAIDRIRCNGESNITILTEKKEKYNICLVECKEKLQYYTGLFGKLDILVNRPEKCNIDSCIFIRDALKAKAEDPKTHMVELQNQIESYQSQIRKLELNISNELEINKICADIKVILRSISINASVLNKLPNGSIFSNTDKFLLRLANGDNFNDIKDLYQYINYGNYLELYKVECEKLKNLEASFELNKGKAEMIDELTDELTEMMNKLHGIENQITSITQDKLKYQTELQSVESEQHMVDILIDKYKQLSELHKIQNDINSRLSAVKDSVAKISAAMATMNNISSQLANIMNEIEPKQAQLDQVKYSIAQLEEYKKDLKEYNGKYALIETIKKYSSPTKGGIQMVFMKLYMDRTLSMSNQLLSLLFEGQLELLNYQIDENEFKIPCRNNTTSMINDDISSCSTAERSMISMIISFALLYQSSPRYNLLRLDEADATLDQDNKSQFPVVIRNVMNIMGVEMCLMVSHSSEIDMSDVDIISLSRPKEPLKGNVIFSLY